MDGDGGHIADGLHAPHTVKEPVLGKDGVGMLSQEKQKVILLARHARFLAVDPDPAAVPVDLQATNFQNLRPPLLPAAHQALIALDVALHAGHQLAGGKGLGHIVVGPQP